MNKIDLYPGQRKSSRAVATISKGTGKVRINNIPAELLNSEVARELVLVPLKLIGDYRDKVDISVKVHGGGFMKRDIWTGLFFSLFIMWSIIITSAGSLYTNGVNNIQSADEAALALEPLVKTFPHEYQKDEESTNYNNVNCF